MTPSRKEAEYQADKLYRQHEKLLEAIPSCSSSLSWHNLDVANYSYSTPRLRGVSRSLYIPAFRCAYMPCGFKGKWLSFKIFITLITLEFWMETTRRQFFASHSTLKKLAVSSSRVDSTTKSGERLCQDSLSPTGCCNKCPDSNYKGTESLPEVVLAGRQHSTDHISDFLFWFHEHLTLSRHFMSFLVNIFFQVEWVVHSWYESHQQAGQPVNWHLLPMLEWSVRFQCGRYDNFIQVKSIHQEGVVPTILHHAHYQAILCHVMLHR